MAAPREGTDDSGTPSRRRRNPDQPTKAARKPWDPKRLIASGLVLILVVLVFIATQRIGGADAPERASAQPRVGIEKWSLRALQGGAATTLCAHDGPDCDPDQLWTAHQANATCTFSASFLMVNHEMPIILRSVAVTAGGNVWSGDYEVTNDTQSPINITTTPVAQPVAWDNGWWWRAESERIHPNVEVSCDAHRIDMQFDIKAKGLDGDTWTQRQTTTISLHTAYFENFKNPRQGAPIE